MYVAAAAVGGVQGVGEARPLRGVWTEALGGVPGEDNLWKSAYDNVTGFAAVGATANKADGGQWCEGLS